MRTLIGLSFKKPLSFCHLTNNFLLLNTVPVYQQQDIICYARNNETVTNAPNVACKTNIVNTLYDVTKPKQQIFS